MIPFDNSYARLPDRFFARVAPTAVREPRIVKVNDALAERLGIAVADLTAEVLAGNAIPAGAAPIALAYAGHQFGHFTPQLGDGRAVLLGEVVGKDGRRDIQLKGAGRTPFSRGGDGRAALGPVLREYLLSEAMAALGIPTTRALAFVTTGERVVRDEIQPGAILTRVAASHVRVGTFEYFAARDDEEAVRILVDHAIERHCPDGKDALDLLRCVIGAQASLVARWMGVGFIHGVMNTDNTAIGGETIDYGPCAFLDTYDPRKKFSSIDMQGRYAFGNQPKIAQWNLARLAETLLPLFSSDEEEAVRLAMKELDAFVDTFETAHTTVLRAKLGLHTVGDTDRVLALDLLGRMAENEVDFTIFFRRLASAAASTDADASVAALFANPGAYHDWAGSWRKRLALEDIAPEARAAAMRRANPAFIPRNERVEEAIAAATLRSDFGPFETLLSVLGRPYEDQPAHAALAAPPGPAMTDYRTFCGT